MMRKTTDMKSNRQNRRMQADRKGLADRIARALPRDGHAPGSLPSAALSLLRSTTVRAMSLPR